MAGNYDNTNSGALFQNNNRQSDRSPDYRGTLNVDGMDFWVSAWVKESRRGEEYISLSITPKEKEDSTPASHPPRTLSNGGRKPPKDENEDLGPAFPSEDGDDKVPF